MGKPRFQEKRRQEIDQRTAPSGDVVYHAVYQEGQEELERGTGALAWSGLAAGLSMGFSLVSEALLRVHLPEAPWRPIVAKLGYSVGFLIVVLGRQQLFTKTTLTAILPLLKEKTIPLLVNVSRLWGVVLLSNLIGAFIFAWILGRTNMFDPDVRRGFEQIGNEALAHGFGTTLLRAVFAGWLIALTVWLLPFAEAARVWVIVIIAYVVGLGRLTHVIAGGVETFFMVSIGQVSLWHGLWDYIIPSLIGNTIGGVALVAALAHAQFMAHNRSADL